MTTKPSCRSTRTCGDARRHARQRGFTLIEILVTFAVVAVLLGLAAPSFIAFQRNAELTSSANSFLAALSAARAEAMKRQLNAYVIPAVTGGGWASGWRVCVDLGLDADVECDAADEVLLQQGAVPSSVTVVADGFVDEGVSYAMFSGAGAMRRRNGSFGSSALELTNGSETRRIIANPAGRLRVCNPTADESCTASGGI